VYGNALFFSRNPIPCHRDVATGEEIIYYKHIGVYAYSKKSLHKISTLSVAPIERAEQLEQLRWLYHGLKIQVHETKSEVQGIDLPEHLTLAEELIKNRCRNRSSIV
jgi:3-deoxy-manno-octulosonate cytidylyltransferase (CMP-KDO synthetase)